MIQKMADMRKNGFGSWPCMAGILTYDNAPGIVPPPLPPATEPGWSWIEKDDLGQCNMLQVLYEWHDLFYDIGSKSSVQLHKALNKVCSG